MQEDSQNIKKDHTQENHTEEQDRKSTRLNSSH